MSAEPIDIVVTDKVAASIRTKILAIGEAARASHGEIERLQQTLQTLNSSGLATLRQTVNGAAQDTRNLARAQTELAAATQRSTQSTERANLSYLRQESALNRAVSAELGAQTAAQRLAAAQAQTAAATTRAATAAAQGQAATVRLAAAQSNAAAAATRAATAQTQAAVAAERLRRMQDDVGDSAGGAIGTVTRLGSGLLAVWGGSQLARGVIEASDAFTLLENKLRNVAESESDVARLTNDVYGVARRARTEVGAVAQSFQRFDLAMRQLGASQSESLRLTETVSKAIKVSGANTNESASALLQLSQAFNKGKLDGDEFRTVMELMPTLMDAIAKRMGVTRGELLELAPQGKITAQVMRDAFADAGDAIDAKFAKTMPTVQERTQQLGQEVSRLVALMDRLSGTSQAVGDGMSFMGRGVKGAADEFERANKEGRGFLDTLLGFTTIGSSLGFGKDSADSLVQSQTQLANINALLESGNLSEERRNRLLKQQTALQREINAELAKNVRQTPESEYNDGELARLDARVRTMQAERAAAAAASKDKPKKATIDEGAREIQNLREKLALTGQDTELERVNAAIKTGKYANIRPAQEAELRSLAALIDAKKLEVDATELQRKAREDHEKQREADISRSVDEIHALRESNKGMREEIETIGVTGEALAAIEIARVRSIRTLKEEQLARLANNAEAETERNLLAEQITLLKERESLISQRATKTRFTQEQEDLKTEAARTGEEFERQLTDGILNGFRNGKDMSDVFLDELKAQFAKTVLSPLIQPIVQGGSDLLGQLVTGIAGAVFGGGMTVDPGGYGITSGNTGLGDYGLGAGRAYGGSTQRNTLHPVAERGPELYSNAQGTYLLTGNEAGRVTPLKPMTSPAATPDATTGGVKIIINNKTGGEVKTEERQGGDGREIEITIERVVSQSIARGGKVASTLESQYGLNRTVGVG